MIEEAIDSSNAAGDHGACFIPRYCLDARRCRVRPCVVGDGTVFSINTNGTGFKSLLSFDSFNGALSLRAI